MAARSAMIHFYFSKVGSDMAAVWDCTPDLPATQRAGVWRKRDTRWYEGTRLRMSARHTPRVSAKRTNKGAAQLFNLQWLAAIPDGRFSCHPPRVRAADGS